MLYTELVEGKPLLVRDSDKLYDLFDLVTAMDEFFSTGTARKLNRPCGNFLSAVSLRP